MFLQSTHAIYVSNGHVVLIPHPTELTPAVLKVMTPLLRGRNVILLPETLHPSDCAYVRTVLDHKHLLRLMVISRGSVCSICQIQERDALTWLQDLRELRSEEPP